MRQKLKAAAVLLSALLGLGLGAPAHAATDAKKPHSAVKKSSSKDAAAAKPISKKAAVPADKTAAKKAAKKAADEADAAEAEQPEAKKTAKPKAKPAAKKKTEDDTQPAAE